MKNPLVWIPLVILLIAFLVGGHEAVVAAIPYALWTIAGLIVFFILCVAFLVWAKRKGYGD